VCHGQRGPASRRPTSERLRFALNVWMHVTHLARVGRVRFNSVLDVGEALPMRLFATDVFTPNRFPEYTIAVSRRLAAIFAADVEGYSRLMGTDEVGTLKGLAERRAILDGLLSRHRGRIAITAGDKSRLSCFGLWACTKTRRRSPGSARFNQSSVLGGRIGRRMYPAIQQKPRRATAPGLLF